MTFGLQTFNSAGNETLNTNYQISRIHSTIAGINVAAGGSSTVAISGMVNDGTWNCFILNQQGDTYITINNGSATVSVPSYAPSGISNGVLIIIRVNGESTSSGYGLFGKNDYGGVQIDQNFSNFVRVGGANNVPVGTFQTLPAGYNFNNSILLARPSGVGRAALLSVSSNNAFTFTRPAGNSFDWLCYAPASSVSVGGGYGMRVYDGSGQVVFDTNFGYLKYAGRATVPLSSFNYVFDSSPQFGEKSYALINNLGLYRFLWANRVMSYYWAGLQSTDGTNIGAYTQLETFTAPIGSIFSDNTFGTERQYTYFHGKTA
jgi:hypothetical protein